MSMGCEQKTRIDGKGVLEANILKGYLRQPFTITLLIATELAFAELKKNCNKPMDKCRYSHLGPPNQK